MWGKAVTRPKAPVSEERKKKVKTDNATPSWELPLGSGVLVWIQNVCRGAHSIDRASTAGRAAMATPSWCC